MSLIVAYESQYAYNNVIDLQYVALVDGILDSS